MMAKELEEGKRDRDRLIGFEREVGKRREEGVVGRDVLAREIAKVRFCHECWRDSGTDSP